MTEREQVIAELLYLKHDCLEGSATDQTLDKAIALLKAHETATVEPKRIDLDDETKAWLDKMDAVDALGNIANICIDWDGYRTADGLGGLINEIWAYARYCADRLLKAQEPDETRLVRHYSRPNVYADLWLHCEKCGGRVDDRYKPKFCPECGRKVNWE